MMRMMIAGALAALSLGASAASYDGPIFDAHLHYNDDALGPYPIASVMELFSKNGVKAILANSRPNDGTRALVEAQKKNPRPGFHVVPFIRVYRDRSDYGTWFGRAEVAQMIEDEHARGFYRGVGEFHLNGAEGDTPVVKRIVDFAVSKGLLLHCHCDPAALEILYRHNPKARVIWAHTGFSTPLAEVDALLAKHPQLWGELSYRWDVVDGNRLAPEWKAFFTKRADRFVTGSDTWVNQRWQTYPEIIGYYRNWLGQLPPEAAAKIAWKNAAALFGLD